MVLPSVNVPVVEAPVLIVGSSMVGMTLSALLTQHGLQGCIAVEKHSSTAIHPRAAIFHPKTMQIYRELGLHDTMKEESLKSYDERAGLYNVESLAGMKLASYSENVNHGVDPIHPTSRVFLTQQMFEPMLRKHATERGAKLEFSTELLDFHQDEDGVTALTRQTETGQKQMIRAKYLVACDGSKSQVRTKLGIAMRGYGTFSNSVTIYFEAGLGKFVMGKYSGVIHVNNKQIRGFFRLNKFGTEGFLVVHTYGDIQDDASRFPADEITTSKAAQMLRAAIGADVDVKITLLAPWRAACDVADKFNSGRVILAGDAAHVNTPNGGFGGNTGIQDVHNLAFKLALVLSGKAGRDLVEKSYNEERRPVAQRTINQVFQWYLSRTDPELLSSVRWRDEVGDIWQFERELPQESLELGYRYHSRAVCSEPFNDIIGNPSTAVAEPGNMAHHVLMRTTDRQGSPFPIADLLGNSFILLAGSDGIGWLQAIQALQEEAQSRLPALDVFQLTAYDSNVAFYARYAISTKGCVLIRPDGFVAWSTSDSAISGFISMGVPDPKATLNYVLRRILCLEHTQQKQGDHNALSDWQTVKAPKQLSNYDPMFRDTKELEHEKAELMQRVSDVNARLDELKRADRLQNELLMLKMKIHRTILTQN